MSFKTQNIFTSDEVAKICNVSPRTVAKWFDSGRLRGYRIPGTQDRRVPRVYLIRFLKEHGLDQALIDLEAEDPPEIHRPVSGVTITVHPDSVIAFFDRENRVWTIVRARALDGPVGESNDLQEAFKLLNDQE